MIWEDGFTEKGMSPPWEGYLVNPTGIALPTPQGLTALCS